MSSINSIADVILDWEDVLGACHDNAEMMRPAEPIRMELEQVLARAKDIKNRKESAIGSKQQLSQELKQVLKDGKEIVRRLRGAAKAQLGTKNERLVQFKARPIRDRKGRRTKKKVETPPVEGTKPTTQSTP
jgi:hypothetical protein